jgi:hypothetical protein
MGGEPWIAQVAIDQTDGKIEILTQRNRAIDHARCLPFAAEGAREQNVF